jgi:DNA-binding transcriptional LysR family regulator
MEMYQLESLVYIIELKSFSKAAKKMFVTQPTISNNIMNLEKELGTVLINRKNRDITQTTSGEILYAYAKDILNTRDQAVYEISKHEGKIEGILDIAASSIPEQYILPKILKTFQNLYPGIIFNVKHRDSKQVIRELLNGQIGCGIVGARYDEEGLEYIEFCQDRLVLATSNNDDFPWQNGTSLEIDLLRQLPIIMREEGSGTRRVLESALNDRGISTKALNIISSIESNETIKQMIALGMGVSFISEAAIQNEVQLKKIKSYHIKNLDLKRKFFFVYHKNRALTPMAKELKKHLQTLHDKEIGLA